MEVDEIQRQVSKFQRVSSNGSTTTTDNSSNPQKLATSRGNLEIHNHASAAVGGAVVADAGGVGAGGIDVMVGSGGVARLCGWPSSRIVRVSRASGGKDRHSKVLTSKGLRDRRVRLSVGTAIQFYDLQDRLGYDQPSKAVEWLLKAASSSIDELPSLDLPIGGISDHHYHHQMSNEKRTLVNRNDLEDRVYQQRNSDNTVSLQVKSPVCSSTSETSKGSELSLSRSENRVKARERARELASKKEKEKDKEKEMEIDSIRVPASNQVNVVTENSSFTDLLTGGINTTIRSPMEYILNRQTQASQLFQIPQFNFTTTGDNNLHHFSFLQDGFLLPTAGGGGERHNLNFSMTSPSSSSSSSSGGVAPGGYTRGTLQSNLPSATTLLPHHHHHLQRFQSSSLDGSNNFPFFIVPNSTGNHFPSAGGYHFSYGGSGDHQKDKGKN